MNEIQNLETFVRVADLGSFTDAARALGVRQPTVSRRVAELERELGVALVVRTTRRVALTEAGLRYLEPARAALGAVQRAREAAQASAALSGVLRVAAPVSLTTVWLSRHLGRFVAAHEGLDLVLELAERHVDLVSEGIDVAVRIGGPDHASLAGRRLRRVERHWVASPGFLQRHGPIASADDLADHRGLVFAPAGQQPRTFAVGDHTIAPRQVVTASNGLPLRQLARDGVGVALVPDWLIEDDLAEGRLVRILPDVAPPTLDLWVVWPQHRFLSAATRAFVDWIVALVDPAAG